MPRTVRIPVSIAESTAGSPWRSDQRVRLPALPSFTGFPGNHHPRYRRRLLDALRPRLLGQNAREGGRHAMASFCFGHDFRFLCQVQVVVGNYAT